MCGAGVGFSCERQIICNLPFVPAQLIQIEECIVVDDSRLGWVEAYNNLVAHLYQGEICRWDLSAIRPRGTLLRTMGGRASGPEPLDRLFHFTIDIFNEARTRRLTSIEVHKIVCNIAEIVVVGGVRYSSPSKIQEAYPFL